MRRVKLPAARRQIHFRTEGPAYPASDNEAMCRAAAWETKADFPDGGVQTNNFSGFER